MVGARAHEDHAAALGPLGGPRELAGDLHTGGRRDGGVGLLPGGGGGGGRVVVGGRPAAGEPMPPDTVLGEQQVEHRGHERAVRPAQPRRRNRPAQHLPTALPVCAALRVEARQQHLHRHRDLTAVQAQLRLDPTEFEVPPAPAGLGPAEPQRTVRNDRPPGHRVEYDRLPLRPLVPLAHIRGPQELRRHMRPVPLRQRHQERQVGEPAHVVREERRLTVDEELLEDHMPHRERQRPVRPRMRMQPLVGELRVVRVVRRDHHDLLTPVARLRHPVRVRRPGHRDIGAPHHQIRGVPPVTRLRHVRLVAEDLRRGHGKVRVPVVERQHRRADQRVEARTRCVRHHRHRRNRRETRDPVGAVRLDRVHMSGRDELHRLVPARPHQAALAPRLLVAAAALRVLLDVRPGQNRIRQTLLRLPVHLQQDTAHIRVAHPRRRIRVPGERGAPWAAPRLVLGAVRTHRRIVRLLGLPGDDPVLDVHLPAARARAVHPVRGIHDLVVAPPVAVEGIRLPPARQPDAVQIGGGRAGPEEPPDAQQRRARLRGRYVGVGHLWLPCWPMVRT